MRRSLITKAAVWMLILLLSLPLILTACGNGTGDDTTAPDSQSTSKPEVTLEQLTQTVERKIASAEGLGDQDPDFILYMMGIDTQKLDGITVKKHTSGTSLDEYGILKLKDGGYTAKEAEELIGTYLKTLKTTTNPDYFPQEFPKLEKAEYRVAGNYLIYAILSDSERASVLSAFSDALK